MFLWQGDKPVQQLKRQLADAYGALWSFPSTHGTTILNTLALLSACPTGGRVLVNRDAHSSVTAAIIHGAIHPVYLVPEYDVELGMSLAPALSEVTAALDRETSIACSSPRPTTSGSWGASRPSSRATHDRGIPVVVDAAHAPHFHFCDLLPRGAEELGADLVAQSTHKVANALSQGSLLLINRETLIEPLYEHVNDLGLVSTSFSYPILASIELAVRQLVEEGERIWTEARLPSRKAPARLPADSLDSCFGDERSGRPGFGAFDPTRVTLQVGGTGSHGARD